jgi:ribosomal protein S18 acetylase RimI-like enzyme
VSDQTTTALPRVPTPPDTRPALTAHPVLADRDALHMGLIRNRRREGFSHDASPIDPTRQLAWWREMRDRLIAYLYAGRDGVIVGYGCLRQEPDGRWYSSVAVDVGHEGRGHGKAITTHLVLSVDFVVWATAREDNPAARKLHDPLVWEEYGWHEGLRLYRTRPQIRVAQVAFNLDHCGVLGQ